MMSSEEWNPYKKLIVESLGGEVRVDIKILHFSNGALLFRKQGAFFIEMIKYVFFVDATFLCCIINTD